MVLQAKFQLESTYESYSSLMNMSHLNESSVKREKGHLRMNKARTTVVQDKEILIVRKLLQVLKSMKPIKPWIQTIISLKTVGSRVGNSVEC